MHVQNRAVFIAALLGMALLIAACTPNVPSGAPNGTSSGSENGNGAPGPFDYTADPNYNYVKEDPSQCVPITFLCEAGTEPFTDEHGCGCKSTVTRYLVNYTGPNTACTLQYDPVCGWFKSSIQCLAYPCAQTYRNACQAGGDDKVSYYTKGVCPTEPPAQPSAPAENTSPAADNTSAPATGGLLAKHDCPAGPNGEMCMDIYEPVCGYANDTTQTYPNSCWACKDSSVTFYTNGACPGSDNASASANDTPAAAPPAANDTNTSGVVDCNAAPRPRYCDDQYTQPVCATRASDGFRATYGSPCLACQTYAVANYTIGACPFTT